ncbi:hypothetical protein R1flu_017511 [Riccia fluitans]|uniref:Ubiquitin-like protease family profile domain-containing protein n=1 Tax=Riccia fluitans TaxID=41844 RepID=A0ABD1ZDG5_9MARC
MNARVALMERRDLYELLEAKMEGFQRANHPRMIGGFKKLNLTIFVEISGDPMLNLEEFEKYPMDYPDFVQGHRTLQDEVDQTGIDVCYQSLLDALKATIGTLSNSLAFFKYMRSIFDSYIIPTNDSNVQPFVKGLDADDFSMDKFFDLQDSTSLDDAQASPDFEEDLRINERVRLQAEVRNLGAEPQWLTRSTRVCLEYEPTILPDVPSTDNPTHPVTLDLTVDAREDTSFPTIVPDCAEFRDEDMQGNLPAWIFVPIHGNNHWSLAIIRIHNDVAMLAHFDSFRGTHDPEAIFHVLRTVLYLTVPIDPALVMTGTMNIEQQQDGHSCGKHVLQMLAGVAKESEGLDRYFREEGLRYIATLE